MISPIIYMNRCVGGCMIMSSTINNAATNESTIPAQAEGSIVTLSEGQLAAAGVTCCNFEAEPSSMTTASTMRTRATRKKGVRRRSSIASSL